jgi:hypothetical protein
MRTLYTDIRTQLETEIPGIHVRLWNNQIKLSEEGEQIPFLFPAVFIDFPYIQWAQGGKGTQRTQEPLIIRLYICFESFATAENEEDLDMFDLRQKVYLAVQDFKPTQAGKLMRVAEQTDPNHTNVYMWVMDFNTTYMDKVAEFPRGLTPATITTLDLTKDLQIDPATVDGIRTDKGFS